MPDRSDPRSARRGLPAVKPFGAGWQPPVDVVVHFGVVWIRFAAPGVSLDDVEIGVHGRIVSILCRRTAIRPPRGAEFVRAEIPLGAFEREIELPWDAELRASRTRAVNGIIELVLERRGLEHASSNHWEASGE